MHKLIINWFYYWVDFFRGIVADDYYDVTGEEWDTPIYDQLEREWARKGFYFRSQS